jgi:hypothetical protein
MKLTDFDKNNFAPKALAENYKVNFDVSNLTKIATQNMLRKIRTLALEAKESPDFQKNQTSPSYMKLVFMEQALVEHYNSLLSKPATRIVFENEEVEKSQVVLAAQDMVDTIQKMLEDIGQMQVKELPALVDSIESEIGVNEAQTYNDQVSSQLDTLSGAMKAAFAAMKAARDSITGQGGGSFTEPAVDAAMGDEMAGAGDEMAGMDAGADAAAGADMAAPALEMPPEEPEAEPTGGVGRPKR